MEMKSLIASIITNNNFDMKQIVGTILGIPATVISHGLQQCCKKNKSTQFVHYGLNKLIMFGIIRLAICLKIKVLAARVAILLDV